MICRLPSPDYEYEDEYEYGTVTMSTVPYPGLSVAPGCPSNKYEYCTVLVQMGLVSVVGNNWELLLGITLYIPVMYSPSR